MVSSEREAYDAVWKAWRDPGVNPGHHRAWQARLRSEWPALALALDTMPAPGAPKPPPADRSWIRQAPEQTHCRVCGRRIGSLGAIMGRLFLCGHGGDPRNALPPAP